MIESCGGAVGGGHVVETPGKIIRIDYLRRAIDELTRDRTSEDSFFYRGVPVNTEAWLAALCAHDIATYVPTRWTRKRARRLEVDGEFREGRCPPPATTTRKLQNDVFECEGFVDTLVEASRARGILLERVKGGERADVAFRSRGRAIEGLGRCRDIVEGSHDVETYVTSRMSLLDVEELAGLFSRGGHIVVSGSRDEWWSGFAVEPNGDVARAYDAEDESGSELPFCPGDAVCRPRESDELDGESTEAVGPIVPSGAWTIVATDFCDDDRSTIRVHATSGLSVDIVAHAETTRDRSRAATLARRVAKLIDDSKDDAPARGTGGESESERRSSVESSLSRSRSDIARLVAMVVRRDHEPWVTEALRKTRSDIARLLGKTGENERDRTTTADDTATEVDIAEVDRPMTTTPTACRNAWVLSDGRTVEVRDRTLTRAIIGRRRWNVGKKCPGCQRCRHPDPFVAGCTACPSASCERVFRAFSMTMHWKFRNGRRKRIEIDMNAPLFTDESLALLRNIKK